MAITNTCLLFQQFSKTIQEDIESGYCMHAILFYSVNNSRDDFKSLLASLLYIYLFLSLWSQVVEETFRSDCQSL